LFQKQKNFESQSPAGAFGTVFDIGKGRCIKVENVFSSKIVKGVEEAIDG
jgi:hypothetical protein